LDLSKNTALKELICYDNPLTTLDLSKNKMLTMLRVIDCALTTLDLSNNTLLVALYVISCQLSTLDVSNNAQLRDLICYSNQLTSSALNDLFRTLPYISEGHDRHDKGRIGIVENPGASDCDFSIATEKNWIQWYPTSR